MTYLELLGAFVTEKRKLLVTPIILNNLTSLSSAERESYFRDIQFFNFNLDYKHNTELKLKAARLVKYDGVIACGNIFHNMLYLRSKHLLACSGDKAHFSEYIPGGLLLKEYSSPTKLNYKFVGSNKYVSTLMSNKTIDKYLYELETLQDYASSMCAQHHEQLSPVCDIILPELNSNKIGFHAKGAELVPELLNLLKCHLPETKVKMYVSEQWVYLC